MKGIFRRSTTSARSNEGSTASSSSSSSSFAGDTSVGGAPRVRSNTGLAARLLATALGPQYSVPPFPVPLPHRYISLHCLPQGLFLQPLAQPHQATSADAVPRSSDECSLEDVADDVTLASLVKAQEARGESESAQASSGSYGARIPWGRDEKAQPATAAEVQQARKASSASDQQILTIQCYGVIGVLRVFNGAYLFVITSRRCVGDYLRANRAIYQSTGVLAIPLTYEGASATMQAEAKRQLNALQALSKATDASDDDDEEDTEGDDVVTPSAIPKDAFKGSFDDAAKLGNATLKPNKSASWLPRSARAAASENASAAGDGEKPPGSTDEIVNLPQGEQTSVDTPATPAGLSVDEAEVDATASLPLSSDEQWHEATKAELEDKVVKETARQYSRGEMWFTYDFDLTSSLQKKQTALEQQPASASTPSSKAKQATQSSVSRIVDPNVEPYSTLPLWRRADRKFWHNEHLSSDFVEAGLHGFVLPLMQGYVQITQLPVLENPSPPARKLDLAGDAMDAVSHVVSHDRTHAQLLIISRRSKERAGLRYQRRGVNGQGQVANFVESEQVLFLKRGQKEAHVLSFVQFRGSIPLYWKQDPFSMKPPPLLDGSEEENRKSFAKHFDTQVQRYDRVIVINLAEQHGKEGVITKAYSDAVEKYNEPRVTYKAFDFHEECKGMRFERVSKLIDELKDTEIKEMNCFWKCVRIDEGNGRVDQAIYSRQNGAFRVSCLDCLDRTNVVQSAFARYMLSVQLERLGIHVNTAAKDEHRDEAFDLAFNDAWANNGDMVSQIYAGTRALKGDFTRTGKRNLMGMMNDATNSVYRMVQGAVTDFFKQTVIDFQYGYSSLATLERYNDNLAAPDPSQANRLARARAMAVETTAREVVTRDEKLLAGWTLFSPIESNRIETPKLEEKVVLLTDKALYSCGYDFTAGKLAEFSKIKIGDIIGIKRGVYILSPHEGYHPENHWGFVVTYIDEERRLNTASVRSKASPATLSGQLGSSASGATNFVAFRAVVDEATVSALQQSSVDLGKGASSIKIVAPEFLAHLRQRQSGATLTSHDVVDSIVAVLTEQCIALGACDEDDLDSFIVEETIRSLAQAKANASLFAPLIEGIKRRVWL